MSDLRAADWTYLQREMQSKYVESYGHLANEPQEEYPCILQPEEWIILSKTIFQTVQTIPSKEQVGIPGSATLISVLGTYLLLLVLGILGFSQVKCCLFQSVTSGGELAHSNNIQPLGSRQVITLSARISFNRKTQRRPQEYR